MGLFRGQYYTDKSANHLFVSNHPAMLQAGLASFNIYILDQAVKNPQINKVIGDGFKKYKINPNTFYSDPTPENFLLNVINTLEMGSQSFTYDKFDTSSNKYVPTTVPVIDIINLINWYENVYLPDPETYKTENESEFTTQIEKVYDIQRSRQRYLEISRDGKEPPETLAEGEIFNDFGEKGLDKVYIRFYMTDKARLDSRRVVVPKGSPVFTDTPRRVTGSEYSMKTTTDADVGVYVQAKGDNRSPSDLVTAPLRCSYNDALGCWDIQNTILARLINSVDAAPITAIDVDITTKNGKNWYDPESEDYAGQFTTGLAIPMSAEGGNPHAFGPNMVKCVDTEKAETIRVVNRAAKSYSRGSLVKCDLIGGEWIVSDFGPEIELTPPATQVTSWQFAKFIACTKDYFQGAAEPEAGKAMTAFKPPDIEEMIRFFYYGEKSADNPNGFPEDEVYAFRGDNGERNKSFKLNTNLIQSSIFDQYSLGTGQSAEALKDIQARQDSGEISAAQAIIESAAAEAGAFTTYKKTNWKEAGEAPYLWSTTAPLFWGPVFSEGYQRRAVKPGTEPSFEYCDNAIDVVNVSAGVNKNLTLNNIRDKHMPAEIAINGPFSPTSSPVESYHYMARIINNSNFQDFSFLSDSGHLNYKYYIGVDNERLPLGCPPTSQNTVQFTLLSAEFACMDDTMAVTDNVTRNNRAFRSRALDTKANNESSTIVGLGAALTRGSPRVAVEADVELPSVIYKERLGTKTVPYDLYNEGPKTGQKTCPDPFNATGDENGSELVGVITGRNSVFRKGGGVINIEADQYFGFTAMRTATFTDASAFVLPIGMGSTASIGGASFVDHGKSPVWGHPADEAQSFGETNMFVKVYDAWPAEQTCWLAPYFMLLHFNSGVGKEEENKEDKVCFKARDDGSADWSQVIANADEAIEGTVCMNVQVSLADVDVRIPSVGRGGVSPIPADTFITPHEDLQRAGGGSSGAEKTEILFYDTKEYVPERYSAINKKRRGKLLTLGGYQYEVETLGLGSPTSARARFNDEGEENQDGSIYEGDRGSGFTEGEVFTDKNGVAIEVTSVMNYKNKSGDDMINGIADWKFAVDYDQDLINKEVYGVEGRGSGFILSDFSGEGYEVRLSPADGVAAKIRFKVGKVYRRKGIDEGPVCHNGLNGTKITSRHDGTSRVDAINTTQIQVAPNADYAKIPDQYDCVYFCHNDIGHTFQEPTDGEPGGLQHITVTIS